MKNNIDLTSIFKAIADGFRRYNLTIFIVVLVGGLATAVLMLNATLQQSSDVSGYTPDIKSAAFDQLTADRIMQLRTSSDTSASPTLPSGRINPFSE